MASKAVKVARAKFDKLAALNADVDAGGHIGMAARREKVRMYDHWTRRGSKNIAGCFDHKKARAAKRNPVTVL